MYMVLLIAGWLAAVLVASPPLGAAAVPDLSCRGCNVLFLNLDFVRTDYLGLTSDSIATPHTDGYFRNSIIFDNTYSPSGSSYRGDLSVMTAISPHYYNVDVFAFKALRAGNLAPWKKVFTDPPTIAEILSGKGYDTRSLNKGYRSGQATFLDRGFKHYRQFPLRLLIEDSLPVLIEELSAATEPFFVLYHAIPTRLHRAYYPVDRPRIRHPHILYFPYRQDGKAYGYKVISDHGAGPEERRRAEHRIYRQQLVYADEMLASLYDYLDRLESNTIIVFVSNHGTQLGDKGIFASDGVSFESSVRVPLIIKHPNLHRPIRVSTPASTMDLVPTILEMLGIDPLSYDHDGISLLPLIRTGAYVRPYVFGKNDPDEYVREGPWKLVIRTRFDRKLYQTGSGVFTRKDHYKNNRILADRIYYNHRFGFFSRGMVREGQWELHVQDEKEYLLFNLAEDPDEALDLSDTLPEKVEHLQRLLEDEHRRAESRIRELVSQ